MNSDACIMNVAVKICFMVFQATTPCDIMKTLPEVDFERSGKYLAIRICVPYYFKFFPLLTHKHV